MFVTPPSAAGTERQTGRTGNRDRRSDRFENEAGSRRITGWSKYDYLVINDDLERCAKEMHSIIQGEHDRVSRNADFIDDIRKELKELGKEQNLCYIHHIPI